MVWEAGQTVPLKVKEEMLGKYTPLVQPRSAELSLLYRRQVP